MFFTRDLANRGRSTFSKQHWGRTGFFSHVSSHYAAGVAFLLKKTQLEDGNFSKEIKLLFKLSNIEM